MLLWCYAEKIRKKNTCNKNNTLFLSELCVNLASFFLRNYLKVVRLIYLNVCYLINTIKSLWTIRTEKNQPRKMHISISLWKHFLKFSLKYPFSGNQFGVPQSRGTLPILLKAVRVLVLRYFPSVQSKLHYTRNTFCPFLVRT